MIDSVEGRDPGLLTVRRGGTWSDLQGEGEVRDMECCQ